MEHRWGKRVSVEVAVGLEGSHFERATGCIANLSISGAWIRSSVAPPAFTAIWVLIDHQSVPAWVVRSGPGGFGVEWCELAPPQVNRLLHACQHAADADTMAGISALINADKTAPASLPVTVEVSEGTPVWAAVARVA